MNERAEATNGVSGRVELIEYKADEKGEIKQAKGVPPIYTFENPKEHETELLGEDYIRIGLETDRQQEENDK
jgi:hypothetical protein